MSKKIKPLLLLLAIFSLTLPRLAWGQQVDTALGNIETTPGGLTQDILTIAIGIAGGVSFLLMLYGGFLFLTSSGDENKLHEATEVITSAIAGLLMIIFSVFLLQLIGKDILQIF